MGKAYVLRGITPPRNWTPKRGDVVYLGGEKTILGKPDGDMFPLRPQLSDGTTDMGVNNLRQCARIEK